MEATNQPHLPQPSKVRKPEPKARPIRIYLKKDIYAGTDQTIYQT